MDTSTTDGLPDPGAMRQKIHTRTVSVEGYRREDGLWDIEGEILDMKAFPHALKTHVHPPGAPLHRMRLRMTVDQTLTIRQMAAVTLNAPYSPECNHVAPVYASLVGLRIAAGFRSEVARRVGGTQGCTHLTELVASLATGAIQTTAGLLPVEDGRRPLTVGGCHAFREWGPLVREYFPQWYRKPEAPADVQADGAADGRAMQRDARHVQAHR